jgi:hypothetical protein
MAGLGGRRERWSPVARCGAGHLALAVLTAAACGGNHSQKTDPLSGDAGVSGADGGGGAGGAPGCPDLFAPTLQTFSLDVAAADWAAIQAEFQTVGQLPDNVFVEHEPAWYPAVFHYGAETVADAFIRLRGDSSWREAAQTDGATGKMQMTIFFDHVNSGASFHGVSKIKLDMPRTDPSFLRDRVGNNWLRSIGIPAVCATSAKLTVNGSYYGLFVAEESVGHRLIKQFFPGNSGGDLWDGGETAKTNELNPNRARQQRSGTRRRRRT